MRLFLTSKQLARTTDLNVQTIRGYIRDGRLSAIKDRRPYLIVRDVACERLIAERTINVPMSMRRVIRKSPSLKLPEL